jgi:predicted KAP-like P-loop ATPase
MVTLKIDVSKIDKAKLFKGEKGVYLNAVLLETPNSEYSDYMIVQETTKEEREAGIKGNILGNAKELKFDKEKPLSDEEQDNLPF